MAPSHRRVSVLLFASGACALVYQVAWTRVAGLFFGTSTAAAAAVLAAFLGGVGAGSLYWGRKVEEQEDARPLLLYAKLEAAIAVLAAASPWLWDVARAGYVAVGGSPALGNSGAAVVRLLLAAAVLGGPTFLMGGTLPAAARAVETDDDAGRRRTGALYGCNALGAVAGAFGATFVGIEALGLRGLVLSAAAVNLLVAGAAALQAGDWIGGKAPAAGSPVADSPVETRSARAPVLFVAAAAAIAGFAFLIMEIVWYRMLAPLLGGSSYTLGLVLAVVLAGIGCGALTWARGDPAVRPGVSALAASCALEAGLLLLPWALGDRLAVLAMSLRSHAVLGFEALVVGWTVVCLIVVFPASAVAGWQFPLLIDLLGSGRKDVGRHAGLVYAANTAGAVAGALAGGFLVLPLLGAPVAWRACGLLLVALAAAGALVARVRGADLRSLAPAGLAILVSVALLRAEGPTSAWRHTPIGAGRAAVAATGPNGVEDMLRTRRRAMVWEREGVEASVAIEQSNGIAFLVNGKSDGNAVNDISTAVMCGLIPAALHPSPRSALVVGLGTGTTAGWLGRVPSIERVDVFEIEPAIIEVASRCALINRGVLGNPRVTVRIGDARELLLADRSSWDIVVSEPSNPYRAGVASLFVREYYEAVRARLAPGGIFAQWLQAYEVDAATARRVIATLASVFPNVEVWETQPESDLVLVASDASTPPMRGGDPAPPRADVAPSGSAALRARSLRSLVALRPSGLSAPPPPADRTRLRARLAEEPFRQALRQVWRVDGLEGFLAGFVAGPGLSRAMSDADQDALNTDDRPLVEFGFARSVGSTGLFKSTSLRALAMRRGEHRPRGPETDVDWGLVEELRAVRAIVEGRSPQVPDGVSVAAVERVKARQAWALGSLAVTRSHWSAQPEGPVAPLDLDILAEAMADAGDPRTLAWADRLAAERAVDAEMVRARFAWTRGQVLDAAGALSRGFVAARMTPLTTWPMVQRGLQLAVHVAERDPDSGADLFEALEVPFAAGALDADRRVARVDIAARSGDRIDCADAFQGWEPHVPWTRAVLESRETCYRQSGNGRADAARRDLERFLAAEPPGLADGLPGAQPASASDP